ncbi:unnamed protein product [Chilo suppressalis]|uniref:Cyclin N-terminal domain-containing protein n=1 Tax=Chilo suppressalis TaxID=168631 RepID=A0ABN8BDV5_CHISP|nr:unnamed protein product [Chilo suppressalis]
MRNLIKNLRERKLMSDQIVLGTGGPPYEPSARKSIHNHENCIFAECNHKMGHYGLKKRREQQRIESSSQPSQDQGVDEVDNVMSKFARQSSPLCVSKNRRRNSLSAPDDDDFENDSDSDGFAHQSLPSDFYKVHNDSSLSPTKTRKKSNKYLHSSLDERYLQPNQEFSYKEQTKQKNRKFQNVLLPICGLVTLVAAIYGGIYLYKPQDEDTNVYDESKFYQEISDLGDKYQISEHSLLELQTGLSTISKRNDSGSFIFVYNERFVKFDPFQFNNFIEDIAITAAKYLRNSSRSAHPTIVQSTKLKMKTHSELMNTYRNEVAKTGVLLIKDIDMIPSSLAMAFHYFCDEYNPLVSKAAIFFTLNLERCTGNQKSIYMNIEKCLAEKWNTVPRDNIKPLLARVVNVVIDLNGIS